MARRQTAEAIQVFTGLTEDYPELPEPYNNLAVLYAQQGDYEKARDALEAAQSRVRVADAQGQPATASMSHHTANAAKPTAPAHSTTLPNALSASVAIAPD